MVIMSSTTANGGGFLGGGTAISCCSFLVPRFLGASFCANSFCSLARVRLDALSPPLRASTARSAEARCCAGSLIPARSSNPSSVSSPRCHWWRTLADAVERAVRIFDTHDSERPIADAILASVYDLLVSGSRLSRKRWALSESS